MQRNLHNDLLEKLRNCTNDVAKGCELIPQNPKLMVGEGFYDRSNLLKDVETAMGGMDLYKWWFS